jgi:endonuclease YncB( thermonuclease family)
LGDVKQSVLIRKFIFIVSLICIFIGAGISVCFAWQGKVVGISDGDTITVMHNGKDVKIRVYGIDAPERGQAFGRKAKQFTSEMVFGKTVDVDAIDTDKYGRTVAMVRIDGKNLSEEIVKAGYAWVYRKHCTAQTCSDWIDHEHDARLKEVGLWAESVPIPPWEYRKREKNR